MARKDNKGRNLKTGEYQRPDGRYEYRYKDEITGKRNSVYAADLASLREMEKKINKDMDDLLITDASVKKLTVNTLFERYMATKNIKERTKKNYIRMWDYRIRNTLGNIRVVDFKTSHVRTFFSALSDEGLAHSTIKGLYGLLNPSFELAVEDGIIRKNPVTGTLGDYGACLRVSETIGLTWSDVDMKNREIHVGGQLVYYEGDEGYCFHDSETKTDAGIRDIPMTQMVYDAFRKQRELNLMPPISSHTLRHTGCTRLGENNVNPKVMQYVMGHSDAQITMNVYNHIAEKSHVENEMSKMNLPETVPAVV